MHLTGQTPWCDILTLQLLGQRCLLQCCSKHPWPCQPCQGILGAVLPLSSHTDVGLADGPQGHVQGYTHAGVECGCLLNVPTASPLLQLSGDLPRGAEWALCWSICADCAVPCTACTSVAPSLTSFKHQKGIAESSQLFVAPSAAPHVFARSLSLSFVHATMCRLCTSPCLSAWIDGGGACSWSEWLGTGCKPCVNCGTHRPKVLAHCVDCMLAPSFVTETKATSPSA